MNIISLLKLSTKQELHQEKVGPNSFKLQPIIFWSQENKGIHLKFGEIVRYQRDEVLVGASVSHPYGPCRIPGAATYLNSVWFWFSPLLQKVFLRIYSGFPLCSKTTISKTLILSGSGMVNEFEPLCECATPKSLYTHQKLICKPHGSLSTFLNPIQTGFFLRFP